MTSQQSILARIEASGGRVARVRLRDVDGTPRDATEALRRSGRYEILGELASGGIGAVLRARDMDLGRDVAVKVLHEKHLGNPELVQRLIEEAQIGGQLQHPAIVPVYEIGLDDRNVPFLAMKLVKGETMTALLQARRSPESGQRRFLSHFLQACRAMAYAHSRGVIHRDLKPSNLMVGNYGEVMILDWGFAKVLSRGGIADERRASVYRDDVTRIETVRSDGGAESVQGSIMGTPAYMPPEQALGHIDDLDKRSDVFSLGAILCEILTGVPPYGTDASELIYRAAQGAVDEAFERLDKSGADEGLVEVCKACLQPLRRDRHKDARVLSDAIQEHLDAMETRARRMEVVALRGRERAAKAKADAMAQRAAAKAARTQAEEEQARAQKARDDERYARAAAAEVRRTRKQALLIAAAVLAVVLLGGGGFLINRNVAETRMREARERVDAGVTQAQHFRADDQLGRALVAARQARDVARQNDVDAETRARVEALAAAIETAERERKAAEAKRQQETVLLADLERCRLRRGRIFTAADTDKLYESVLKQHKIDLRQGERRAAEVLEEFLDPEPVIDALHDWAWLRQVRLGRPAGDWANHLRAADLVDKDPWRSQVRSAILNRRKRDLVELVAAAPADLPPRSATLAGIGFAMLDETDRAIEVLSRAQLAHGGDPWMLSLLAFHSEGEAASRYASALVAILPGSAETRLELAYAGMRAGAVKTALRDCEQAARLDPDLPEAHTLHAALLEHNGEHEAALAAWRRAAEIAPGAAAPQAGLGMALLRKGDTHGAWMACRKAAKLAPDDMGVQLGLAKASLAQGQLSQARAAAKGVLQRRPNDAEAHRVLGHVFLSAKHVADAQREMDAALAAAPRDPFVHNSRGILLLERSDLAGAQAAFTAAAGAEGPPRAAAWANLGTVWLMRDDLRAAVDACREAIDAATPDASAWFDGFTASRKAPLDHAIQVLKEIVKRNRNYAYAHHRLGIALEKKGEYLQAIGACKEALRAEPGYGYCMQTLAWIYATCPVATYRNSAEAVRLAERLAGDPTVTQAERSQILGIARYRAQDFPGAAQALQESIRMRAGGDAWDWYFLAMARWKLGNEKTARRWFAKAQAWTAENASNDPRLDQFRKEAEAMIR